MIKVIGYLQAATDNRQLTTFNQDEQQSQSTYRITFISAYLWG